MKKIHKHDKEIVYIHRYNLTMGLSIVPLNNIIFLCIHSYFVFMRPSAEVYVTRMF